MSGLTATGFVAKTQEELLAEVEGDQRDLIDEALDLSAEQPLGQINGIYTKKLTELWELCQTLANAMNPRGAENFLLDNLSALTGTLRDGATKSKVFVNCTVNNGFTAAAGAITLNPTGQPEVTWTNVSLVGPLAVGTHSVEFQCTEVGPIPCAAGTLTVITVPVSGLNSVTNPLDAALGSHVETDVSLRARREDELTAPGACTVDAIRADVLKVDGVKQCFVFENTTLYTDANGLPGKAIEVVIFDGNTPLADDEEVATAIWNSKPSGSETFGATTVMVSDANSVDRAVKFSRAAIQNVYLDFDVTVDPSLLPSNGADLIKAAVVAYGDAILNLGRDVFAVAFKAQALTVPGVLDVPELRLGFAPSPTGTSNLAINGRQIADVDTSRVIVNINSGSA